MSRPLDLGLPMLHVLGCIYAVLTGASLAALIHPSLRGPSKLPIRQAIHSWWPPALVGGVAVVGGKWAALLVFAGVSTWALREYLELDPVLGRHPVCRGLAYLAVPLQYAAVASADLRVFWAAMIAWTLAAVPALTIVLGPDAAASRAARLQLGLLWTVFALSHVAWLLFDGRLAGPAANAGYVLVLLLAVMVNDAAQYVAGKAFGRTPLAPKLSPRKTVEGLAGGAVVTMVVTSLAAPNVTALTRVEAALLGVILSLLGTLGDLMVSAVKREANVKDSGRVLPGQGGVLDRCDSLILTAPLFTYAMILRFA